MRYICPLIAVKDMERSKTFYREVLGLGVTADYGCNVTLEGPIALQEAESWRDLIKGSFSAGRDGELYFEEDDFDGFAEALARRSGIEYVHRVVTHRWGQRAVRFCDPDGHIIEVGERLEAVCRRFAGEGMNAEEIAQRMDVPESFVREALFGKDDAASRKNAPL